MALIKNFAQLTLVTVLSVIIYGECGEFSFVVTKNVKEKENAQEGLSFVWSTARLLPLLLKPFRPLRS